MYRGIDKVSGRRNIDNLITWSTTWRLLLNPLKCKVMTLGRTNGTLTYTTNLSDSNVTGIAMCDSVNDLGITVDNELNFAEHIDIVSKKANKILAVIRKTFMCIDFKCSCLLDKTSNISSVRWIYFLVSI